MITKNIQMSRGQTYSMTLYAKDDNNVLLDLTDAIVYVHVRADMKVDPQIKLASEAVDDHRIGVAIDADQTGSGKGKFVVTFVPEDTSSLAALGADDPYFYEVWVQITDEEENVTQFPVVSTSRLDLYPQVTTIPVIP